MMEATAVIKYPVSTERTIRLMEAENKLVFICDRRAKKPEIKQALQELFNMKIKKVNTFITRDGNKKAFVTLSKETTAMDVATQLGML